MSTDDSFTAFLRDSFDVLRRETPDLHVLLCRRLDGAEVELRVGGEAIALSFAEENVAFHEPAPRTETPGPPAASVEVVTTRAAILDLIDAEMGMLDSVLAERLSMRGALADLVRFHEGLTIYLHGAMRAPSFRDILGRFRDAA